MNKIKRISSNRPVRTNISSNTTLNISDSDEMAVQRKKLIVVLGMHRSGTSAITRGLKVLGVDLGDALMEPFSGINDKGFWEDLDFNALNIEMLKSLENDWHYLTPISSEDVDVLRKNGFILKAVELLRKKLDGVKSFGFKDPRVAKLMPFWKQVFKHCNYDVGFVLAVRNPLSVVKSLASRDDFLPEKSYMLWLGHVLASLSETEGQKRVLVDYDVLMQAPNIELNRIAKEFDFQIDVMALETYENEFLDKKLQHTRYTKEDLLLDNACYAIVREAYMTLHEVATCKTSLENPTVQNYIAEWQREFSRNYQLLTLIDRYENSLTNGRKVIDQQLGQLAVLNQNLGEKDDQLVSLNQNLVEKDDQLASLNQHLVEKDDQLASLNQHLVEKDDQLASLNQHLVEKDDLLELLNKDLVNYDKNLALLNQTVYENSDKIVSLNQVLSERNEQISALNGDLFATTEELRHSKEELLDLEVQFGILKQGLLERDEKIAVFIQNRVARETYIAKLTNSNSWFLTKPFRWVSRVIRGDFVSAKDPFKRVFNIKAKAKRQHKTSVNEITADNLEEFHQASTIKPAYAALSAHRNAPIPGDPGIIRDESKLIAFYLPQFHRIKENSEWWGAGFTEWTNVAKGKPNFSSHYQPHIPRELGFYDLSNVEVMHEQAELARHYGINGFCFYYYWFSGRRVLERPIDNFIKSDIDLPFCLCWANENWTRTWDGKEENVLLEQKYLEGDEERFIQDLLPSLLDHRYIRVENKPMLLVYRIKQLPDPIKSIKKWRDESVRLGLPGLHIVVVDFYDISDPLEVGADALVEFPPHKFNGSQNHPDLIPIFTNPSFLGGLVDYSKMIMQSVLRDVPNFILYRGIIPSWDNTARRQNTPTVIVNNNPLLYGTWLRFLRKYNRLVCTDKSNNFIFVNAWNEWGEGCHLEPDLQWGLQYLEETARSSWFDGALENETLDQVRENLLTDLKAATYIGK